MGALDTVYKVVLTVSQGFPAGEILLLTTVDAQVVFVAESQSGDRFLGS